MQSRVYWLVGTLLTCGAACASTTKAPAINATPNASQAPSPLGSEKSPKAGVVHISPDIRKACGIADADAHFPFDSAQLGPTERPVLSQLARCFVSGPLQGRDMRLVGHADPRGDADYNMVLGGSRADTVKTFLTMHGMPAARIGTTSRGEMEARGTDASSWAEDRRVDVLMR